MCGRQVRVRAAEDAANAAAREKIEVESRAQSVEAELTDQLRKVEVCHYSFGVS